MPLFVVSAKQKNQDVYKDLMGTIFGCWVAFGLVDQKLDTPVLQA